jgi:hypothetical protein
MVWRSCSSPASAMVLAGFTGKAVARWPCWIAVRCGLSTMPTPIG